MENLKNLARELQNAFPLKRSKKLKMKNMSSGSEILSKLTNNFAIMSKYNANAY